MSFANDLGPLSWVKGEIDLALASAGEALSKLAVNAAEMAQLKYAQTHLHQARGALAIVGLDGLTQFASALEQLLSRNDGAQPASPSCVDLAQRAVTAMRHYLEEVAAGASDQPLKLLPLYEEIQKERGEETVNPSDLFYPDLSLRPPKRSQEPPPLPAGALAQHLRNERLRFERGFLHWLRSRDGTAGLSDMRQSIAAIERSQNLPAARAFWWATLGFIDALAERLIPQDLRVKRLCARIDAQMRRLVEGSRTVAERLMRDVLYYVAIAEGGGEQVRSIKEAYDLGKLLPQPPAEAAAPHASALQLRHLREVLGAAKEAWDKFCAGSAVALPQFDEQAGVFAARVEALGESRLNGLGNALRDIGQWLRRDPLQHHEAVAMETATALLLAENIVENFGYGDPETLDHAVLMTERLNRLSRGEPLEALHAPLLGEISRRAQEKLMVNQVAREIQVNLAQIEQTLDAFFRDNSRHAELAQLATPLKQVEGALAMLNQDAAAGLLRECAAQTARFATGEAAPQEQFEDIAHKLSALGFFVEALQHGKADLDAILRPTQAETEIAESAAAAAATTVEQELEQQKRDTQALVEALRDKPQDDALRRELKQNLEAIRQEANLVADSRLEHQAKEALEALAIAPSDAGAGLQQVVAGIVPPSTPVLPSAETARLAESSSEEIDAELLGIFLEEAHDVLDSIGTHLERARSALRDQEALTIMRRGFHTLKGSGRMVGLRDLGEVAWDIEQVMNRWLQQEMDATPALLKLIGDAHALLSAWVAQLATGGGISMDASDVVALAERLKSGEEEPIAPPPASAPVAEPPVFEAPTVAAEAVAEQREDTSLVFPPIEVPAAEPLAEEPCWQEPGVEPPAFEFAPIEMPAADTSTEDADSLAHETPTAATPEADQQPAAETIDAALPPPPTLVEPPTAEPLTQPITEPPPAAVFAANDEQTTAPVAEEIVTLGDLSLSRGLYDMFLKEAWGHVATLRRELARLHLNPALQPSEPILRAAHTLGGIASTVGLEQVSHVARSLEHALTQLTLSKASPSTEQSEQLNTAASTLEGMVDAVANQRAPQAADALIAQLDAIAPPSVPAEEYQGPIIALPKPSIAATAPVIPLPTEAASAEPVAPLSVSAAPPTEGSERRTLRLHDDIDEQLLPIFLEESQDLIREIGNELRRWHADPASPEPPKALARLLHTLKGSARMTGAMALGELVHGMETRIESAVTRNAVTPAFLEEFDGSYDRASQMLEDLRRGERPEAAPLPTAAAVAEQMTATAIEPSFPAALLEEAEAEMAQQRASVRVRAELVDRFVNDTGEISIARARVEGEMRTLRSSLLDLTENVIRLRRQLREIEIQAESQMQSRLALAEEAHVEFDPLEFDRFTRFQELTRMMAESVNDVSTVQHNLLKNLDSADAALVSQARINRDLAQALMSVRMVPFGSVADRLYRVVRQTAKELAKKANLDIRGGQIELDRGVLEQMAAPIEHLLRNAISHGLEPATIRQALGKSEIGQISIQASVEGNEISIELADDGAGLDFDRIREKAVAMGLLGSDESRDEQTLADFIFRPGFSTAAELSEIAGRGIGMDVVRNQATALGGRIEVSSERRQGARFRIYLPQTLAVSQALLVRSGGKTYALPSVMVEQVLELKSKPLDKIVRDGAAEWLGARYPYHYLPRLLGDNMAAPHAQRYSWVLLLRGGTQRIALHVDELAGNQEIVIKNTGPQLARITGISGATVLGNGDVVLILNPVALAGREPRLAPPAPLSATSATLPEPGHAGRATVMVIDDSLTVRKITGRLLEREGYRVLTAKDGVDALEKLLDTVPDVMLVDIEMPRMDGFDLTRNVRADERLKDVPIIMITSRIAEKHRSYAREIGVNHYLGKPYQEEELLAKIAEYIKVPA